MSNWGAVASSIVLAITIYLATAPQREVARRELERQDALIEHKQQAIEALAKARETQANELIEQVRNDATR